METTINVTIASFKGLFTHMLQAYALLAGVSHSADPILQIHTSKDLVEGEMHSSMMEQLRNLGNKWLQKRDS